MRVVALRSRASADSLALTAARAGRFVRLISPTEAEVDVTARELITVAGKAGVEIILGGRGEPDIEA
jgi:hypothetical protein